MATVISASLNSVLNKLFDVLKREIQGVTGMKNELQKLQRSLQSICDLIETAEKMMIQDKEVNQLMDELKEILYEVDDIIDLSSSSEKEVTQKVESSNLFHRIRFLVNRNKDTARLNNKLKRISKLMIRKIGASEQPVPQKSRASNARKTSPFVETDVVEPDNSSRNLLQLLSAENKDSCQIFTIVGMAGSGKTTLMENVFNDLKTEARFAVRVWLYVSKKFSPVELLWKIISTTGMVKDRGVANEEELLKKVRESLLRKTFLIALDDVWGGDVWLNLLQKPLQGLCDGRIMVTTREENVAREMGSSCVHHVRLLSDDAGWKLLQKITSLETQEDIDVLQNKGKKIVRKCGGLPLAIKIIGGVLKAKDRKKGEWKGVLESEAWSMDQIPMGGALYLSYEYLPSHLKQCFLYLSLFPQGHIFDMSTTSSLLVTEGFVTQQGDEQLLENKAEEYLIDLIRSNLLQLCPEDYNVNKFVMHDLVWSLARFLSRDESFCGDTQELETGGRTSFRRLSLQWSAQSNNLESIFNQKSLRTLMLKKILQDVDIEPLTKLSHLRVLILRAADITSIPDSIGELIHIRYLDLSDNSNLQGLPESIKLLGNLQVLELVNCCKFCFIPEGVTSLHDLRRLELTNTTLKHLPKGIGKLKHLNLLHGLVVGDDTYSLLELNSLSSLRSLSIVLEKAQFNQDITFSNNCCLLEFQLSSLSESDKEITANKDVLEKFRPPTCLQKLVINSYFSSDYPTWINPSSEASLPNLKVLELWNCKFCTMLPALGQIPNLTVLKIVGASAVKVIGEEFSICNNNIISASTEEGCSIERIAVFPKLEYLYIRDMPIFETWNLSKQFHLPSIQVLEIVNCPNLNSLPEGLQSSTKMKRVKLSGNDKLTIVTSISSLVLDIDALKGLRIVSNLTVESLHIKTCSKLESISTLVKTTEVLIYDCPRVKLFENADELEYLEVKDVSNVQLPPWVKQFIQARKEKNDKFKLVLRCHLSLLESCCKGRRDWKIIRQVPSVILQEETGNRVRYLHFDKRSLRYELAEEQGNVRIKEQDAFAV